MRTRKNLPLLLGALLTTGCVADAPFQGDEPDAAEDGGGPASDGGSTGDQGASAADSTAPPEDAGQMPSSAPEAGAAESGPVDASGASPGSDGMTGPEGAVSPDVETGRLMGITAAHNAVRAMVSTQTPLPPLVWSQTLADYAQQWATQLATTMCAQPQHRSGSELQAKNYGENLATFEGRGTAGAVSTAQKAVDAWAGEVACWTYGSISGGGPSGTEKCDMACYMQMNSDGCGHYTQIVWRKSTQLGCGVATCMNGQYSEDIWICNYAPAGNIIGQAPY